VTPSVQLSLSGVASATGVASAIPPKNTPRKHLSKETKSKKKKIGRCDISQTKQPGRERKNREGILSLTSLLKKGSSNLQERQGQEACGRSTWSLLLSGNYPNPPDTTPELYLFFSIITIIIVFIDLRSSK
jgi:hypothetical protein